jgi:predicted RNase H-like nuclease
MAINLTIPDAAQRSRPLDSDLSNPSIIKFLGIDLGWQSGPSGVCCLALREDRLALMELSRFTSVEDILAWVDGWTQKAPTAVVAVDAPTLIPNETGMRLPDRLAHKYFGQYDAGCYPANRSRPFAEKLIAFGLALESRGFCHTPDAPARSTGKFQLEVFPHPVTVRLFNLPRILKYKKGTLAQRRPELAKLRRYQLETMPTLNPSLALTAMDLPEIPKTGTAMKAVEDKLDSLTCAYAAAHWWYWGLERNWVLGNVQEGYIVGPGRVDG